MLLAPAILAALAVASPQSKPIEVPFTLADDAIIVDASVNGRKVSLLFDTGFTGSVIVDDTIELGKPDGHENLRDFVGEFQAPTVKVTSLTLEGQKIDSTDMEAVQRPNAHYSQIYGVHCDGIMGFEVIKNNITEFDFQHHKLIFYPKSYDIATKVPNNQTTFLAKLLPIGDNSLEMSVVTPSGKKMTMALDTGNAFFATTHRDVLERVGLWDSAKQPKFMKESGVASGAVDSWSLLMPQLSIFGVPVKSSVWDVIDLPSSSAEGDGTVGFGFLRNFDFTIDYERRRVWFERFGTGLTDEPTAETGIFAGYSDRTHNVEVFQVSPDSPAAVAGIKEGDELLSIDGVELSDYGFRRVRKMLEGPKDSTVKVAVSRDGTLYRYDLKRAYLYNQ